MPDPIICFFDVWTSSSREYDDDRVDPVSIGSVGDEKKNVTRKVQGSRFKVLNLLSVAVTDRLVHYTSAT